MVIGISGASGVCYGIRLIEVLGEAGCMIHLVMTEAAENIIEIETDTDPSEVAAMADRVYSPRDFTAPIASGSHRFDAMVVAPCSMRTLAGIASGLSDTLITRTADVCLKERRKLIVLPRESPLGLIHLRNMVTVTEAGATVLPPCPGFYPKPRSLEEIVDVVVGRVLDVLGVDHRLYDRWEGLGGNAYNDGKIS
jgi:4-hydroxy-3-polyprenylbenzoate decarboxylase